MKTITLLGQIIRSKTTAQLLISRLFEHFDGSLEASVAISDIETLLVANGFLTWDDVEMAEQTPPDFYCNEIKEEAAAR